MKRPRILLCWPYDRESQLQAFHELRNDFDFVHLFHVAPEGERARLTDAPIRYYRDFTSAQQVIAELRPAAVVFLGINSLRTMALNVVARRAGIPTYLLQHGLSFSVADSIRQVDAARRGLPAHAVTGSSVVPLENTAGSAQHALRFARASLSPWAIGDLLEASAYNFFLRFAITPTAIEPHFRIAARAPSATFCLSEHDASVALSADGPATPRLLVGNPEYDAYFRQPLAAAADGGHVLFVDSIVAAPEARISYMSVDQATQVYVKLARYAARHERKLVVKLHPFLPPPSWLPRDLPNVEWVTRANLADLIERSSIVFGYFSTLTVAAAWRRPVCLLEHFPLDVIRDVASTGMAQVTRVEDFDPERFELRPAPRADRAAFARRFFFRTDGRATERLGALLRDGVGSRAAGIELAGPPAS